MATPITQTGSEPAGRRAAMAEIVRCQHGARWVVDVATGRIIRKPCEICPSEEVAAAEATPLTPALLPDGR